MLQHLLGIASGLLVYATVRRLGASRPLALVPTAVVLLAGDLIFYEHAVLSEALFTFLLTAALYAAVRALDERPALWAAGAGVLLACAGTVRSVGVFLVPALAVWLLFARAGAWRERLGPAAAAAAGAAVVLGVYVGGQAAATDDVGLSRTGGWALYARVARFADCDRFRPPAGTDGLCQPDVPPRARSGATFYFHNSQSPAWRVFGPPPAGDDKLGAFAEQAILHQPLDYARVVGKDILRYVDPDIGTAVPFSGTGPDGLRFLNENPLYEPQARAAVAAYWRPVEPRRGAVELLSDYQRVVRVHGPLLPLLLIVAIAGLVPAPRRVRAGIVLLGGAAILVMVVPAATLLYGWRYAVPVLPALVGAATLGASALVAARRSPAGDAAQPVSTSA